MGTRREYAASLGLAIAGARGRLSREANAACDKAIADGTTFDGPVVAPKSPAKVKSAGSHTKAPKAPPVRTEDSEEWNIAQRTYVEGTMWKSTSGQSVNATQVCSPCGVSLGWHVCNAPWAVVSPGVLEALTLA